MEAIARHQTNYPIILEAGIDLRCSGVYNVKLKDTLDNMASNRPMKFNKLVQNNTS